MHGFHCSRKSRFQITYLEFFMVQIDEQVIPKPSVERTIFVSYLKSPRNITQENKSDNGSDQPTKSDGIPGNECTNGSDGSALFSLYALISILVNTKEEFYTTIISYRIPIVGPNQIPWKILYVGSDVGSLLGFLQEFIDLTVIRIKSDQIPIGSESVRSSD